MKNEIFYAARHGDIQKMKHLVKIVKHHNELDSPGQNSWTPLLWASESGHESIARLLLEYGVNPNHQNINGKTALFEPASWGHEPLVKLLLKYGINIRPYA